MCCERESFIYVLTIDIHAFEEKRPSEKSVDEKSNERQFRHMASACCVILTSKISCSSFYVDKRPQYPTWAKLKVAAKKNLHFREMEKTCVFRENVTLPGQNPQNARMITESGMKKPAPPSPGFLW